MAGITLKNVRKVYDNKFTAVHDFSMEIKDREFIILVGPSGCGKSTTLRMIAGLEDISSGELYIGDRLVNKVAPKDRDIAMVFQNYALYPHMTIYKNMAFGLEMRKVPKNEIDRKIKAAAKSLDIEQLLSRKPKALSGGQRQRAALGRAIVRDPAVFLFDEPLSNLDAKLRTQMRTEIKRIHSELGTTFVYVTHDQTEAMTMGDRIVVMKDGYIQQIDTPANLYDNPANMFVAGFIGTPAMNFINCKIDTFDSKLCVIINKCALPIPKSLNDTIRLERKLGEEIIMGIRPEKTQIHPTEGIRGEVIISELMGSESYVHINIGNTRIISRTSSVFTAKEGDRIKVNFDMEKAMFFDIETKIRITK